MKTLVKTIVASALLTSLSANANISVSDSNQAEFRFGGTIEPMCKVKSTASADASALTLDENNATQEIGSLEVWCNTGRSATTKYSSQNNGFLVSGDNRIGYTLDVGSFASAVDLANDYTASTTDAGTDRNGTTKSHALKITTKSNGLDQAGSYSDVITVTVSYN